MAALGHENYLESPERFTQRSPRFPAIRSLSCPTWRLARTPARPVACDLGSVLEHGGQRDR
jgi:hypothetical protein